MIIGVDPSPLGATDRGARDVPPKPCCRRIGAWWCARADEHPPAECRTPVAREIASSDFGPAGASRRRE